MRKKKSKEKREDNRLKLLEETRKAINELKHLAFKLEHAILKLIESYDYSCCILTLEEQYRKVIALLHALVLQLGKTMRLIRRVYANSYLLTKKNNYENTTIEVESY